MCENFETLWKTSSSSFDIFSQEGEGEGAQGNITSSSHIDATTRLWMVVGVSTAIGNNGATDTWSMVSAPVNDHSLSTMEVGGY